MHSSRSLWPLADERKMVAEFNSLDWRDRKVREWLLLLLRFAVTLEPTDHSAVLAMADELDSLGARWRPSAPSFFRRTSIELCDAILTVDDRSHIAILRRHSARIQDARLKQAFQAAVGLHQVAERTGELDTKRPARRRRKRFLPKPTKALKPC
jgi:hypothetical protein